MRNPWAGWRVTGDWGDHADYSEGGTDYPLPYGLELRAPAAGRLVVDGWVGSAGRRATLRLDTPVRRVAAASSTRMLGGYVEHACDLVAVVFQHASSYKPAGWYAEGALLGHSGASANGDDWGGDVHLHVHGLCAHGRRVDWLKFQPAAPAGGSTTILGVLMALTDAQQLQLLNQVNSVFTAVFRGGDSMPDGKRSIGQSLADIASGARPVVHRDRDLDGDVDAVPALQDQADTNSMVRQLIARAPVTLSAADQQAVAQLLAAELAPKLEGADVDAIAAAVRDRFRAEPLA